MSAKPIEYTQAACSAAWKYLKKIGLSDSPDSRSTATESSSPKKGG